MSLPTPLADHTADLSRTELYLNGQWRAPVSGGAHMPVYSPATGTVIGTAPRGGPDDADVAVAAARSALEDPHWAGIDPPTRARLLRRFADELTCRADRMAGVVTAENGMPVSLSRPAEGYGPAALLRFYAGIIDSEDIEVSRPAVGRPGSTVVRHERVGVVAAIVPWNFPQALTMFKLAPALAAGCTVVVKPAPETPLDALLLAEAAESAGLPPGVLNVVTGDVEVGRHLVGHPGVDKVAFTGSTAAGREIGATCGRLLRPATLELGGKSAAIVCEDADLAAMARGLAGASLLHASQTCYSCTRILLPRSIYDDALDAIVDVAASLPIGDPADPATRIGPVISARSRQRALAEIAAARSRGARVAVGGHVPAGLDAGYFLAPTVITDLDNTDPLARNELFAPVLSVMAYDDLDDAVAIANDSDYGLGGTIWTGDEERGVDLARRIHTGAVGINFFEIDIGAPFGGVKSSGVGRELGPEGLAAYRECKSIYRRSAR